MMVNTFKNKDVYCFEEVSVFIAEKTAQKF